MSDRYVSIRQCDWASGLMDERCTVIEADDTPQKTGLLDVTGTPLYRVKERQPIGFVGLSVIRPEGDKP